MNETRIGGDVSSMYWPRKKPVYLPQYSGNTINETGHNAIKPYAMDPLAITSKETTKARRAWKP